MKLILTTSLVALAISCTFESIGAETRETTNSIGMKLVRIEPGSFTMGQDGPPADYDVKTHAAKFDDADWDEKPAHRVRIGAAFSIDATEVTRGQYRQFNPKHSGKGGDDITSKNHYVFNLAWLKQLPPAPQK